MPHVEIIIASFTGALLGLLLAGGSIGQKVSSSLFISARKACKMESQSMISNDAEHKVEAKDHSAKV